MQIITRSALMVCHSGDLQPSDSVRSGKYPDDGRPSTRPWEYLHAGRGAIYLGKVGPQLLEILQYFTYDPRTSDLTSPRPGICFRKSPPSTWLDRGIQAHLPGGNSPSELFKCAHPVCHRPPEASSACLLAVSASEGNATLLFVVIQESTKPVRQLIRRICMQSSPQPDN